MSKKPPQGLQVVSLQRMDTDVVRYKFSLTMGGLIVNGFNYTPSTGSVKMPSCPSWGKGAKVGRMQGIHVIRLREKLDQKIEEIENA